MKVALLLFGQPRNVSNLKVFKSHKKFIFDKYDTDVFCHCWYSEGEKYDVSSFNNLKKKYESNPEDIENIKKNYNPVEINIEQNKNFSFEEKYDLNKFKKFSWYKENFKNIKSQLYSINKVSDLFENYINKNNVMYDFVIVARYDLIILDFPNLKNLNKDFFYIMNNHPRFPDLFNIFNPKFIKSQNTYNNFDKIIKMIEENKIINEIGGLGVNAKKGSYWEPSAECLKYNNFLLYHERNKIRQINIKETRNI